ncbi:MAG TPA: YCF48-related protein [Candidatus Acidoferrales bacterium]|nr:YCF48-related protein [Candidatus Acidoferrales bacterium]
MKRVIYLFTIMTLMVPISSAQWNWTWRNPTPTGSWINNVWRFSANELMAVTDEALMHTTNGGATWTLSPGGGYEIFFADANHGWICSGDSVGYTTDHGTTWVWVNTGWVTSPDYLTAMCFVSTTTGWVCGTSGIILKTTDGGITWQSENSTTGESLWGICFTSALVGCAVGTNGVILKTSTGGSGWSSKVSHTTENLFYVCTAGSSVFAFGNNGTALKSTDNGGTWSSSNSGLSGWINSACALDANNIWAAGTGNAVYKTTDGGATWNSKNPYIGGNIDNGLTITGDFCCASFSSATSGIVCGGNGVMYKTTDDGATWTSLSNSFTTKDTKCITFSDAQHGFLCVSLPYGDNTSNALYRTTDGGTSWTAVSSSNSITFIQMFPDGSGIRYAGSTTGWQTTTDNGSSWTTKGGSNPALILVGFEFLSATTGFAFDEGTNLYKTTNSGVNWTTLTHPYVDIVGGYSLPNANTIWIAEWSDGVNVILSTDGGTTWTNPGGGSIIGNRTAVFAFDTKKAWVGNSLGDLFKTTDGGASFTEVSGVFNGVQVNAIEFLSSDTGIVITANGVFSMTFDGGASWHPNVIGSSDWTAIGVASHKSIFLAGKGGQLLQGINGPVVSVKDLAGEKPRNFSLAQNYPNPFNPTTNISFTLPVRSFVSLKVFDILGREVATLLHGELAAGSHVEQWNAAGMPSGVYFYRLQAGSFTDTKKVILLK